MSIAAIFFAGFSLVAFQMGRVTFRQLQVAYLVLAITLFLTSIVPYGVRSVFFSKATAVPVADATPAIVFHTPAKNDHQAQISLRFGDPCFSQGNEQPENDQQAPISVRWFTAPNTLCGSFPYLCHVAFAVCVAVFLIRYWSQVSSQSSDDPFSATERTERLLAQAAGTLMVISVCMVTIGPILDCIAAIHLACSYPNPKPRHWQPRWRCSAGMS
jgi:hypothetical protein